MNEWILRELELMLLLSLLIIGAVMITKIIGKKVGYRWRKALWLMIAISLVVPVAFVEEGMNRWKATMELSADKSKDDVRGMVIELAVPQWSIGEDVIILGDEVVDGTSKLDPVVVQDKSILEIGRSFLVRHVVIVLGVVWGCGALILLGISLVSYILLRKRYVREAFSCEEESVVSLWREVCKEKRLPKILIHGNLSSPMLFGYFNTVVLMPDTNYSEEELVMMLRHEAMHLRQRDLWYKLFISVICDIYWFNPMFRYMKRLAFQDVEYVCDELVIRDMNKEERYSYGQIILKTMTRSWSGATAYTTHFAAGRKTAKTRLGLLFTKKNRKMGILIAVLLLLLTFGIGTTVSFAWKEEPVKEELPKDVEAVAEVTAVDEENVIVNVFSEEAEQGKKYFRWVNMGMTYLTEWTRTAARMEDGSRVAFTAGLDFELTLHTGGAWQASMDMSHDEYCDMIQSNYFDFTVVEACDMEVAKMPTRKIVFTHKELEDEIYQTQRYTIIFDLVMYELNFTFPLEQKEKYTQIVEDTLASIEFYDYEYVENPLSNYRIMLDDLVYNCTGVTEPMGDADNVEGYVAEYVPDELNILRNGQANFDAVGNPYTYDWGDGSRLVLIGDEYYRFELCEEDYLALISGNWVLDAEKSSEALANIGVSLQEVLGTDYVIGNVSVDSRGDFYYAYGRGYGGDGSCRYEDGMIWGTIFPYENHSNERYENSKWMRRCEDGTEYLVKFMDKGWLYFVRKNPEATQKDFMTVAQQEQIYSLVDRFLTGYLKQYEEIVRECLVEDYAEEIALLPYDYNELWGGSIMGIDAGNRMNDKQEFTISYRFQIGNPEYSADAEKQAESSFYLTMQVTCTDNGWKVVSYGLEK